MREYHYSAYSRLSLIFLATGLVKAELDVKIADQQKHQQIILAQGRGKSTRLKQEGVAADLKPVGLAEASNIAVIGKATDEAYQQQVEALGKDSLSLIDIMREITELNVKITPDALVKSSKDSTGMQSTSELLSTLLAINLNTSDSSDKQR